MSTRINIKNTRCQVGSTIVGTVSLEGDRDIDLVSVTISLVGRCKTKATFSSGQSRVSHRGRAAIIQEMQTIFRGPHTLHPGHEWPFAFDLPTHCTARSQDSFQGKGGFNLDPFQDLSPSFQSDNLTIGWTQECFMSYELEANCTREKTFAQDLSDTRRLDIHTTRDIERSETNMKSTSRVIACYSPALQPGRENTPLSVKDKLKGLFITSMPVARFQLKMMYPSVGVQNRPLPLFLEVEHDI